MPTTIITELQKVDQSIDEEQIIDDRIYELVGEDEIDLLFRLYDKLKDQITPGKILRNGDDGISILNEADPKTHAYLVANSKNFLTGDSALYSISEVNALLSQLENFKTRISTLQSTVNALSAILSNSISSMGGLNSILSEIMRSPDNVDKYSQEFAQFYEILDKFNIELLS